MNLLNKIKETKALHLGVVKCLFLIKLPFNFYLLRPHKSDGTFLWHRSKIYLDSEFGEEAIKSNTETTMIIRMVGFEDGYEACLKDLGIKLTYPKSK